MYDSSHDSSSSSSSSPDHNVWSVLSRTERWISETLASAEGTSMGGASSMGSSNNHAAAAASSSSQKNNPYARKEVSYLCDPSSDSAMIVSGIFKRLREARQLGEAHGRQEEARKRELRQRHGRSSASYHPHTLRQTQVVVIPNHAALTQNFTMFDTLMERINRARRNARDYVTDLALEQLDQDQVGDDEESILSPWSVSVNCAHLHPKYGQRTLQQQLQDLQEEEDAGEVDVHYQAYRERRRKARQSPYPSLVVEVRATPPPDFGAAAPSAARQFLQRRQQQQQPKVDDDDDDDDDQMSDSLGKGVTAQDIQRLEALFGQSANMDHPLESSSSSSKDDSSKTQTKTPDEAFYDRIGRASSVQEVTALTPIQWAQQWVSHHVPHCLPTASFTESDTPHVDEAYEFIFTNLAMMMHQQNRQQQQQQQQKTEFSSSDRDDLPQQQFFMVLPHLLSSAATSFEKLAGEALHMMQALPDGSRDGNSFPIVLSTYHPEHIDPARRSPIPILCLEWQDI